MNETLLLAHMQSLDAMVDMCGECINICAYYLAHPVEWEHNKEVELMQVLIL